MNLKFPTGTNKLKNYKKANLGMNLENMINDSNEFYLIKDIAVIHKKPIPVQIVNVNYPARNKAVITEAYYKTASTTDYNGIYKGKYIDFEAKETTNKTSFPIINVHSHQVKHLKSVCHHGGIGFIIIGFTSFNEYYYMPFEVFYKYYEESLSGGRKSIPYEVFKSECFIIPEKFQPRLDYLKVINEKIL